MYNYARTLIAIRDIICEARSDDEHDLTICIFDWWESAAFHLAWGRYPSREPL